MKRNLFLILLTTIIFLAGCSTYKFQRGEKPYDQGYVVYRDGYMIPEYSLGENNSAAAELELAKDRFKRRRSTVEYYQRKLGNIENGLERFFWNPLCMVVKTVFGQLRLPFVAISNYRYNHNPKYKEKVIKAEEKCQNKEKAQVEKIKDQLNTYIQKDLTSEHYEPTPSVSPKTAVTAIPAETILPKKETPQIGVKQEVATPKPEPTIQVEPLPAPVAQVEPEIIPPVTKESKAKAAIISPVTEEPKQVEKPALPSKEKVEVKKSKTASGLKAIIITKPDKGFSPLRVKFYGSKSSAGEDKIVSYLWDFGDGDISTKQNTVNTYYSGSFEPKEFTVTLTIQNDSGNIAKANTSIYVLNR